MFAKYLQLSKSCFIIISQCRSINNCYKLILHSFQSILFVNIMATNTSIEDLLTFLSLDRYLKEFKAFGIDSLEDIFYLSPQDWGYLKNVLPFHRNKIIHGAAAMKQTKLKAYSQKAVSSDADTLHDYVFSSNGPYNAQHKPQNLKNFDPQGYGLTSSTDSFMKFTFTRPINVYGMIIGNNIGVSGGWGNTYLEGVQVMVKLFGTQEFKVVGVINGMPNTANSAYMAKIDQQSVVEVKLWKNSYFSTSFIHFV